MLPSHHLTLTSILLPCPRSDSQRSSRALSAFTPWRRRAYSGDAIWGPYFHAALLCVGTVSRSLYVLSYYITHVLLFFGSNGSRPTAANSAMSECVTPPPKLVSQDIGLTPDDVERRPNVARKRALKSIEETTTANTDAANIEDTSIADANVESVPPFFSIGNVSTVCASNIC